MIDVKTIPPPAYAGAGGSGQEAQGSQLQEQPQEQPQEQREIPTPKVPSPGNAVASSEKAYPPQPYPPTPGMAPQPMPGLLPLTEAQLAEMQLGSMFQNQLFARCARGDHDIVRKHGALGIICAVILFPIGFTCFFLDVQKKCARCGTVIA